MTRTEETGEPEVDAPLLRALMTADTAIDPAELALATGQSPGTLREHLVDLEQLGCTFDHAPQSVRLTDAPPGVWQDYLHWRLGVENGPENGVGYRLSRLVQIYQRIGSTQDGCRRIIEASGAAADGAAVAAHHQDAGRGRLGRRWIAPPGSGVTVSLVHVSASPAAAAVDRLMLASAIGAARGIEAATSGHLCVSLKWPNDLMIDGRKLGGILVETQRLDTGQTAAVIGIGINVCLRESELPAEAAAQVGGVTSLAMHGLRVHRLHVLAEVVAAVEHALHLTDEAELLEQWRARSIDLGQRVHVREGGRDVIGRVLDLDPRAGLVIRTDHGSIVHLPAATTTIVKRG